MGCGKKEHKGAGLNKGQIYRFAVDLDGRKTEFRRGEPGETHYFIILSHSKYNRQKSIKSCLGIGLSSSPWQYSESLMPEHFENWESIDNGYYEGFSESKAVRFQTDKICRLCYDDIESPKQNRDVLKLNSKGLDRVITLIGNFLKIDNSESD